MRKTGIVPNSIGQKLLPAIASRRLCILMVMCATLKSSLKGFVAGSQLALSKKKCWPNILPPKLTRTFGEEGSAELRPALRSGQALDHAERRLS
jgi:hypothetical protein